MHRAVVQDLESPCLAMPGLPCKQTRWLVLLMFVCKTARLNLSAACPVLSALWVSLIGLQMGVCMLGCPCQQTRCLVFSRMRAHLTRSVSTYICCMVCAGGPVVPGVAVGLRFCVRTD